MKKYIVLLAAVLLNQTGTVRYYTGDPDGVCLGSSKDDLIGFYGKAPVAQRSGASQAAVTTTAATTTTPYGFATSTQANGIVTLLNEIRATLVANGMIAGA